MWDPRRLQFLRAVVRHGSFTLAADDLFTTQPAVSRQIAALERELGVELIVRRTRRASPTAAGIELLASSGPLLAQLDAVARRMRRLAAPDGGRVRIGAVPSAMVELVPEAVVELRRRRSAVEVGVTEGFSARLPVELDNGSVDVAVIARLEAEATDRETTLLLTEPFDVLLPRDHPFVRRNRLSLPDLAGTAFVLAPGPAGQEVVRAACADAGFTPEVAGTATWDATGPLVAAGIGVALAPRSTARRVARADKVEIRALTHAPRRSLHLITAGLSEDLGTDVVQSFRSAARILRDRQR